MTESGRDDAQSATADDRRRSPSRGKDRRNLATRLPGVWTNEERQRFIAERRDSALDAVHGDPRRI